MTASSPRFESLAPHKRRERRLCRPPRQHDPQAEGERAESDLRLGGTRPEEPAERARSLPHRGTPWMDRARLEPPHGRRDRDRRLPGQSRPRPPLPHLAPRGPVDARTRRALLHDGRFATLLDVVNHYDSFFNLGLTPQEKNDLVEYLKSLPGED